jgi:alpha-beta hydrolase superfamily lysophospholipase
MTRLHSAAFALLVVLPLVSQSPQPGPNQIAIRAQAQDIYLIHNAAPSNSCQNVLFLPGDGGWRGFAIVIAQTIASWGYDVYAWDTKKYLETPTGKPPLKETEVMDDFHQVAGWIRQQCPQPITLVGWSEGAGLCLLAAASEGNKSSFNGLLILGLTEDNSLAWRWADYLSYLTKREPNEPVFKSAPYIGRVSPLPVWMLQATGDQYVSVEASKKLFAAAREPKHYLLIDASNHRFDGNHEELFRSMKEALESINVGKR